MQSRGEPPWSTTRPFLASERTRPRSTPPCRTRPGSGTTGWAARTTTRSTARPATSIREIYPEIVDVARASRQFLTRAVRYLAGEARVRQFLDIGTGLPTVDNTHEVAQRVAPDSRIVYVDNDPLVLAHARALLTSTPRATTDYIDADLHDPDTILAAAAKTLDFSQPVALMLMGILGHVDDYDEARSIVKRLLDALPSGSYLAIYDGTNDLSAGGRGGPAALQRERRGPVRLRSPQQIAGFFEGLELVEPGVVSCPRWRPDPVTSVAASPSRWTNSPGWVGSRNRIRLAGNTDEPYRTTEIAASAESSTGQRCLTRH